MAGNQHLTPRPNRIEPNLLIDGGMIIWPEGTSRTFANNTNGYGAVLFQMENTSTGVTLTNSQQASVPGGTELTQSNQVSKTAAGTLAAGTISKLNYYVEGYDIQKLWREEFSIIFWVKSTVASNRSLSVKSAGSTHSYVQQYNIAAANTWELKVLKLPALSTSPATLNRTNGVGIQLGFNIVTGTTFQTANLNQWQAGNFLNGTGEDTTWLTGTTHDFNITGVMILPGDWTTLTSNTNLYRFVRAGKNIEEEVSKADRYFQKSYSFGTNPGTITDIGAHREQSGANGVWRKAISTKCSMRANPSVIFYNNTTGAANSVRVGVGNFTPGAAGFGENSICFEVGGVAANSDAFVHWTFDARF